MKRFIIYSLIIVIGLSEIKATEYYSVKDGNWTLLGMWALTPGGKPTTKIPIQSDIIHVTTNVNLDVDVVIHSTGRLIVESTGRLTSTESSLEIKNGGAMEIYGYLEIFDLTLDNSSDIVISSNSTVLVHNDFTNKNNTDGIIWNGTLNVLGQYYNGNNSVIGGCGRIYIQGDYNNWGEAFGFSNEQGTGPKDIICGTLPIVLSEIDVKCDEGKPVLFWSTASELNNSHFEIIKSDDLKIWSTISSIPGAGNSNVPLNYSFVDYDYKQGNSYYKLRQVDYDGKSQSYDIISSNCKVKDNMFELINISVKDNFSEINFVSSNETPVLVKVSDSFGKSVHFEEFIPEVGHNNIQFKLNMNSKIYIVQLVQGEEIISQKFLAQK